MESTSVDLTGLLAVGTVSGLLAGFGLLLDKLVAPGQRIWLSDRLTTWWVHIESLKVPNLVAGVASAFLALKDRVFGRRLLAFRFAAVSIGVSIFLTTASIIFGDLHWFKDIFETLQYFRERDLFVIYSLNYLFDAMTLIVTIFILSLLLRTHEFIGPVLVVLDGTIAVTLAVICWTAATSIEFPRHSPVTLTPPTFHIDRVALNISVYIGYVRYLDLIDLGTVSAIVEATDGWIRRIDVNGGHLANWIYSGTSLIPTVVVLLILTITLVALIVLRVTRFLSLQLLRLDVETEKTIFFYTGVLAGLVASATKALIEVSKLV